MSAEAIGPMLRLALRNIVRQRFRSSVTMFAIVLGVAGLILVAGFIEDVFVQLGEATIRSQVGHLQIHKHGYIQHGVQRPLAFLVENPEPLATEIRRIADTQDVLFRLNLAGLLNNGRTDIAVRVQAGDADREARLASYLKPVAGRPLSSQDAFGVYVGEGAAKELVLKPGQQVTLLANTASGGLNSVDLEVVGIFRSFSKDYDARTIRINLNAAQQLLDTRGVNSIVVLLKRTDATQSAATNLRDRFQDQDLGVSTWVELSDFYAKTVDLFRRQFGFLELVILVMILLCVLNSVNLTLHERRSEIGTIRALGSRNQSVFMLLVAEAAVLGLIGAGIGVVLGVIAALAISAIGIPMPPPPNAESGYLATIRIVPEALLGAFLIGISASTLAALLPALRVSRAPIVDELRAGT